MKPKLSPRETPHNQDGERRETEAQVAVRTRRATKKSLKGESEVERDFLEKYQSLTVLEAVQKAESAANQFIEHVCTHGKFGKLGRQETAEVIIKCIDVDHGAALAFISNAGKLANILEESDMREALYNAVLKYGECHNFFYKNFSSKFVRIPVAQEVHSRIAQMERDRSRFAN